MHGIACHEVRGIAACRTCDVLVKYNLHHESHRVCNGKNLTIGALGVYCESLTYHADCCYMHQSAILIATLIMALNLLVDGDRELRRMKVVKTWQDISHDYADNPLSLSCIHDVALAANESQQYVKLWCTRFAKDGSIAALQDLPRSGRPRIVDRAEVAAMFLAADPATSLRDASARSLDELGVHISRSTASRAAHELALHRHEPRISITLSDDNKVERQIYAKENRRQSWGSTFMLDSLMLVMHPAPTPETGRWGLAGEVLTTQSTTRSPKMHVYAGASPHGFTRLYPVTGTTGLQTPYYIHKGKHVGEHVAGVCQEEFLDVLAAMIQEGKRKMPASVQSKMRVIMDKAAVHTSSATARFMAQSGLHDYLLPTKSPDMNWMDWAIWHPLKEKVWSHHHIYGNDLDEFTRTVHQQWDQLTHGNILQSLCCEQRARMEQIAKDGELIH